jgi:hypothetical protein
MTIEIPDKWKHSGRIMGALTTMEKSINSSTLRRRIAEAERVDNLDSPWKSKAIRENYLACIIEGTILIGS